MKLPVTEWNTAEHDKCPEHFATRDCSCECGHAGSRSLADRGMEFTPYIAPKKRLDNVVP